MHELKHSAQYSNLSQGVLFMPQSVDHRVALVPCQRASLVPGHMFGWLNEGRKSQTATSCRTTETPLKDSDGFTPKYLIYASYYYQSASFDHLKFLD